jgi:DNA topoisomerase-1
MTEEKPQDIVAPKTAAKKSPAKKAAKKAVKGATKKAVKKAPAKAPKENSEEAYEGPGKGRLVIVESPAKARTIEKYLGRDFRVLASVGHVRDLPKSTLGVDIEKDFEPEYVTIRGKKDVLDKLKAAANRAAEIFLATDPDREGEAIAWHVAEFLKIKDKPVHRATFNEITRNAVREAIERPARLDMNLIMAQQSRRILDRLVGYQISPLLWRNVQIGLSAGRVQSVAVRLLCEREEEVEAFVAEEFWNIEAGVEAKNPPPFKLRLTKIEGEKPKISNEAAAQKVLAEIDGQPFVVDVVVKKPIQRGPNPPFITSTLQQEAARKLRFSPHRTMSIAQGLYEGVSLGEEGPVGLITYMRTDSTRVADSAIEAVRGFITEKYGARFLPDKPRRFSSRKGAQDAHEAIRPTMLDHPPEKLARFLDEEQAALYKLIWDRFVASQMAAAEIERTTIEVPVRDRKYLFTATGSVITFPGFLSVYEEDHDAGDEEKTAKEETADKLPQVESGETLQLKSITPEQRFTQPPPRFSMSSLIRELEKRGIGRPSTYAQILTTIMEKQYAERVEGWFRPTDLGRIVTKILIESFPEILDIAFTAKMEENLDEVEDGKVDWLTVMRDFYGQFSQRLETAKLSMRSPRGEETPTDIDCDKCGSKMVIKWGRNGHFLACSNYPECKNTKPFVKDEEGNITVEEMPETNELCQECGAPMTVKNGRHGKFLACSRYPECKGTRPIEKVEDGVAVAMDQLPGTDEKCEKCGADMVVKRGRRGLFLACSGYPKCRNAKNIGEVKDGKAYPEAVVTVEEKCDKCGKNMVVKSGPRGPFLACSGYPACKSSKPLPKDHPAVQQAAAERLNKPKPVETDEKCEKCGKPMLLRFGKRGAFVGCSGFPKCRNLRKPSPETLEKFKGAETGDKPDADQE